MLSHIFTFSMYFLGDDKRQHTVELKTVNLKLKMILLELC